MVSFTAKPKSVCGVFAVPKDKDADRLIIDARPTNRLFVEPAKVKLPTPDLLAQLETDPSRKFFVAKVDLDNFYHRLLLPVWIREYFALPPVRAADVGLESLYGSDTLIFPCCMTLPMGWSHSVLLAQMAHENFVSTHTALRPCDRITSSTDGLVDRIRHQIYIDDLILIGTDEHALRSAQTEYVDAVQAVGLVVKPSKVVAPSELGVECLGLEVDGTNHTVGVSATKLERLRSDTRRMLESGSCSGDDLSHIVGRWTWAALACRSAFSVFSAVYRFIQCARSRMFRIWPSVSRELRTMMGLAPLLHSSTKNLWLNRVVAVDASSLGMGVVTTRVTETPVVQSADSAAAFVRARDWSTIVSSPWRKQPEHINVLEMRALCTAVRWILSLRSGAHRVLVLSDSQVVVGAVSKGRSSSQLLLRRMRHMSALVLASGIRLSLQWIPSAANPADDPSRRF
jgi:hypothetical protein